MRNLLLMERLKSAMVSVIKPVLMLCLIALSVANANAQSTLSAGDIAFIGYNTDPFSGTRDHDFTWIALTDIDAGTEIYFTEQGWNGNSSAWQANSEGHYRWTAPVGGISCGTIVHIYETSTSGVLAVTGPGTISGILAGTGWSLAAGDQVLAYQAASVQHASPTFIAAVHADNNSTCYNSTTTWNDDACVTTVTTNSSVPPGLTNGVNCVSLFPSPTWTNNEQDNAKYTGTLTGSASTLRGLINTSTNWSSDNGNAYDITPSNYTASVSCAPVCSMTASITSQSNVSCFGGSDGSLTVTQSSGTANFNYVWSNGASTSGSASSINTITGLSATTYTVTITDNNACTATASATIAQPGSALVASASVASALDCNGDTDGQVTATPAGGTSPYTYSWNTGGTSFTETGLGAGTYSVTITDQNGCTDSASTTLTAPSALSASASVASALDCNGDSDGQVMASPSGGTSPYTYSWNTGGTSQTETNLTAGTYSVTITDQNGCTDSASTTLTQPSALGASASVASALDCNGDTDGQVMASPSGGTSPYTYSWNTGGTSQTETGLGAGTYSVTITDQNGCTDSASTTLSEPATLSASAIVDSNVSCASGSDGGLTASPSGGTGPYTYAWSNSATTASITGITATAYTVTVTDANGCTTTATNSVTEPSPIGLSTTAGGGSIDLTVLGGIPPITYLWSNGATTEDLSGLSSGTYTVTITDNNGCTATTSEMVDAGQTICYNTAPDTFNNIGAPTGGSGNYVYQWQFSTDGGSNWSAAAGDNDTLNYSSPALTADVLFRRRVIDTSCGDTAYSNTISIIVLPDLVPSINVDNNVSCNGAGDGSLTASATGGSPSYSYLWSNTGSTATISSLSPGTYTVTITDSEGCTATSSNSITEPAMLVAASVVDSNITCNGFSDGGATASATGGTTSYTYAWNNGATTASITGVGAGTYSVTITDANGCTDSASVTITEPALLDASTVIDSNISCNSGSDGGMTASATGGTMAYSYLWSNTATTASITGVSAGTYSVTITDANGCTDSASGTVTEPAMLVASSVIDSNVSCNSGSDGGMTASATGGTMAYTYSWSNGATTASITGVSAGTYSVTITDANGCTDSASGTVTEPAMLVAASVVDSNVSCNSGSDGGMTASATGGTMAYTYSWSNGATTASITGVGAGTYSVTITDANGCTDSASGTVTEPAMLVAASVVDSNITCNGFSDGGATASATGGTMAYTYAWSNSATTASITGVSAGTYSVTITDANGCTDSASVTITEPALLDASTVIDSNISCNSGSDGGMTASATGGTMAYSYLWSNTATNASITGVSAGTYSVTITDANGCTDSASGTVTEPAMLVASSVIDSNVSCNSGSDGGMTASATGGTMAYTYSWSNGATTASITGVSAGTYSVTITDANGCTDSASGTVTEPAMLVAASAVDSNITCNGFSDGGATASATGGTMAYTYSWSNGATTASITGVGAGTYSVTITDANGCTDSASTTITEPALLDASTVVDSNESCSSANDGGLTASATGGTMAYTYAWSNGATTASITGITSGTYSVTITDANGCTDSASGTIIVADLTPPSITCPANQNENVDANCLFTIPDYTGMATASDNCGTPVLTQNPVAGTIVGKGSYTITITATDSNSNLDSCSFSLNVNGPTASYTSTTATGCYPLEVTFTDASTNATSWFWDFGDGTTSNVQNPTHLFDTDTGQFDVMLVVDFGNGCTDTLIQTDYVTVRPPVAAFSLIPANGCSTPHTVFFTDQSTLPDTWFWTFGDGGTSTAQNPIHNYTSFGTFNVLLTVTDTIFGCTDTATAVVIVEDTTPPVVTCPATQTIYAGGSCTANLPDYRSLASVVDACDGSPTVTQSPAIGTPLAAGTHTVTIYGEDWQSNIDSCSFTLVVADSTAPTAVCQNITVYLDGSGNASITAADVDGGSADNCSIASLAINDSAFSCADVGANTVTLTVTDTSGNMSTCNATVTVADSTSPTAVCQNITVYLDGSGNASISSSDLDGGSSDNCGVASFEVNDSLFTCSDVGANTITFTVNDVNGNSSTCTATVTVVDSVAPTITCPANITVSALADNCFANASWSSTANDNCSGYVVTSSHVSGSIFPVGVTTVTDTVTDASGNIATCSFTITVTDDQDPEITGCPANISVSASSATCGNTVNWTAPTASDNCPGVSLNSSHTPGSFFPVGTTTVTYVATDAVGNLDSCQFTVTVVDDVDPVAACQNISVYLDASGNASILPGDLDNGSTDNCGVASLALDDSTFSCANVGTNTITLIVTDIYGNNSTCTGVVTVIDSTAPTAVCQNITVFLDGSGNATITAGDIDGGSSDVCGVASLNADVTSFTCSDVGANTVTLTATDNSGNSSTCTSTVTVVDSTAPTAVCQVITAYLDASGNATITASDVDGGSNDACGINSLSVAPSAFTCANQGPNSVTLTVTDNNGNSSTCTGTVFIVDTVSPTAVCQNITVYLDGGGNASISSSDVDGGSTDACGIASLAVNDSSFTCSDVGANTVTLTVTDIYSNTSTCNAIVTVVDTVNPVAVCQNITVMLDASGNASITATDIDNGSSDACGIDTMTISVSSFTCSNVGSNTVTLTVTDNNGNSSTCTSTVTVMDTVSPVASCQDITVYLDASGNTSIVAADVDNGSSDACGIDTMTIDVSSFTCSDVGANTVTLMVTDNNGNSSTCTSTVTVMDTVSPVAVCQDITVHLDASGNATITAADVDGGSNDACGIATLALDDTSFTCSDVGANTVTLTVTDNNGNSSTCTATVTVIDTVSPVASCQDITVYLDGLGSASIVAADVDNGSSDACGIDTMTIDMSSFSCANVGANTVTLTVTDNNGNSSTCTSTVTVMDTISPIASCQDITVYLDANGLASIVAADVDNFSADNCGVDTMTIDVTDFTCANVGANTVTLTVTDNNGNTSTCTSTVTVMDTVAPVAVCQDVTVYLNNSGNASIVAADVDNGSNDACGIASLDVTPSAFTCANVGTNTVTLTVTDNNGNTSTCTATVTVMDTVPPTAVCRNLTLQLNANGTASVSASNMNNGSFDNCGGPLTYSASQTQFDCSHVGANTVTLTVTDVNGNSSTCTSIITVEDNVAPTAVCQNIQIALDGNGVASITAGDIDGGSSDACGVDTMTVDVSSFTCADLGDNNVVLTVTDANGNSSSCTAVVTVIDITPPFVACTGFTVQLDETGNATIQGSDVDAGSQDVCGPVSLSVSPSEFTCDNIGPNQVTLTVTDQSGNSSTCSTIVIVEDTVSPTAVCQNFTVELDNNGNASIDATDIDGGSFDACGIASYSADITTFTCADIGDNTVTLTVTDGNGNSSTCTATVTVEDNTLPQFICPASITVNNDPGVCGAVVTYNPPSGSDNCTSLTVTQTDNTGLSSGDVFPVGTTVLTYTGTDGSGNVTTCSFSITVTDNEQPVITTPANITVCATGNTGAVVTYPTVTATDNCQLNTLSQTSGFASGSVFPVGTTTNFFTATDIYGNVRTGFFTVTVLPAPAVGFSASNACYGDAVVFNNTSPSGMQYDWDFGDGNSSIAQNPTHVYDASGTYDVTLTVTNGQGCTNTTIHSVMVYPEVIGSASTAGATCNGGTDGSLTVSVTSGIGPYTYTLNGNTQSSNIFSGLAAGNYTVTVTDVNGCTTTVSATVSEPAAIAANISNISGVECKDDQTGSATVQATGGTAPYFYSIDGGPNHASGTFNFLTGGVHTVTITDANGCMHTTTVTIPVSTAAPVAAFTFTIDGLQVLFNDLSTGAASYYWDFGDGTTSTSVNPDHVFADPGAYTVSLVVSNACGSDTLSVNLGQLFTGMADVDNSILFNLYPNPNNGNFTIEFESAYHFDRLAMRVWTVEGRLVSDQQMNASGNNYREDFSYDLAPGVYHVEFMVDDRTYHKRVIVK